MRPLGLIYLTSMYTIPHTWKLENLILVPKPNKDINMGTSYRPISLISVIVISDSLLPYMTNAHRPMVFPHLTVIRTRWLTGAPLHSTSRCPTSTGAVHKSVTFSCVFMLVQLNKWVVVCGSDLQKKDSDDGCLSSSILFKYERSWGHLFVMGWARV